MVKNYQTLLEQGLQCFYSWKMGEAYALLRRYFDRIPFQLDREHAEYIGVFVRVLLELGKNHELLFYVSELERLQATQPNPPTTYILGVVYMYLPESKPEAARKLFEKLIRDPQARSLHTKARMMLAVYHSERGDIGACRALIDGIKEIAEPSQSRLVEIWRGYILRRERRFEEAKVLLRRLLKGLTPQSDWYAFFCAKLALALVLVDEGKDEDARLLLSELRTLFEGRNFRSVLIQVKELEDRLAESATDAICQLVEKNDELVVTYADRRAILKTYSPQGQLLALLMRRRYVDKASIVKGIYDRPYIPGKDDRLIYQQVHALRKRLKSLRIDFEIILAEKSGYRFIPDVQLGKGMQ